MLRQDYQLNDGPASAAQNILDTAVRLRWEVGGNFHETLVEAIYTDAAHIADRSGCRLVIDLERVPLARGATHEDLAFGEDFELLAATPTPDFVEIGHCEEGAGLEIRLDGGPVALSGWEHFRLR